MRGATRAAVGDQCFGAGLSQVKIQAIDDKSVSFSTRCASLSGDPDECLLKTFTVRLSEVYTERVEGAVDQVELRPDATGTLFLSRVGWDTRSADGFEIYGKESALFKVPNCAAARTRLLTKLSVVPSSIVVRGYLEGERELVDIELLGPDATESQQIHWNGAEHISVRLSQRGARRLRLTSRSTTASIWPVRIGIEGAPAIDQSVTGDVDLLDAQMANSVQVLEYARPGSPINLVLTQDGVSAFHVTPQLVAELSGEPGHSATPCVGCGQDGRARARSRASRVARRRTA